VNSGTSAGATFRFRLFVAGDTTNSAQALANLNAICRRWLPGLHEIEVVNVFAEPERALREGVFLTPTLIKLEPAPQTRIVGTLAHAQAVALALGLGEVARAPE
jgi:circadian clock protein KaiB